MTWCLDRSWRLFLCLCTALGLTACNPNAALTDDNLLRGARAETFILNHGALCARLPSLEAVDLYSRGILPENSAAARQVHAWDMSGLLNMFKTDDNRWVMLPSEGLKKLGRVHFRTDAKGDKDALCFGRLWVDDVISYTENKPLGISDAVTARLRVSLKDAFMLQYFKGLQVESYDPSAFTLENGSAYAETLINGFQVDMALRPTDAGWYFARSPLP